VYNLRKRLIEATDFGAIPFEPSVNISRAREICASIRHRNGASKVPGKILTEQNAKLQKNLRFTVGVQLAENWQSGVANVCDWSTPECRTYCVSKAGRGNMEGVQRAKRWRTDLLLNEPDVFVTLWYHELVAHVTKHGSVAHRPDVFSDLHSWQWAPCIYEDPNVIHYGYTKRPVAQWWEDKPANLHLTYSASERTDDQEIETLTSAGVNVTVPFDVGRNHDLPKRYNGITVIDGDKTDERYLDPPGVIVGLRAKGALRRSGSPFLRAIPVAIESNPFNKESDN
jgi:hypothetical protein